MTAIRKRETYVRSPPRTALGRRRVSTRFWPGDEVAACKQQDKTSVAALLGSFEEPTFTLRPNDKQGTGHED